MFLIYRMFLCCLNMHIRRRVFECFCFCVFRDSRVYCVLVTKIVDVFFYFQINMSIIRSIAKATERLEKANSLIAEEKSQQNVEEPRINSLLPLQQSSGLGTLDYEATVQNVTNVVAQKRGSYQKYNDTDRFQNGQFVNENGNSKALSHFKRKFPGLKESTVRTFKKQHQEELKRAKHEKRSPSKVIKSKKRGRPLLLGGLDKMIHTFLRSTRAHGGVVNTAVAIAVADALVKRYPEQELCYVYL